MLLCRYHVQVTFFKYLYRPSTRVASWLVSQGLILVELNLVIFF